MKPLLPLPFWQRLNSDVIGRHAPNSVKRYPTSGGCIRQQAAVAKRIFGLTKEGTSITVNN
jgi:hypothetical protein